MGFVLQGCGLKNIKAGLLSTTSRLLPLIFTRFLTIHCLSSNYPQTGLRSGWGALWSIFSKLGGKQILLLCLSPRLLSDAAPCASKGPLILNYGTFIVNVNKRPIDKSTSTKGKKKIYGGNQRNLKCIVSCQTLREGRRSHFKPWMWSPWVRCYCPVGMNGDDRWAGRGWGGWEEVVRQQ